MSTPTNAAARAAAATLAADATAAEVIPALREAGIPSALLKGSSLVGWLYREDEGRLYGDADVLVPDVLRHDAERVLLSLDFELQPPRPPAKHHPTHARPWRRQRDGATVDLHRTLPGVRVAPDEAWKVLSEDLEHRAVLGAEVAVLAPAARTLLIALHMSHHRAEPTSGMIVKPFRDLRLALERLPDELWRDAAVLATRLHCRERLSNGLHEDERGAALAAGLGLPTGRWVKSGTRTATAAAFERLRAAAGVRARLALAARMLVPSPATMRWQSRVARRGPVGLTLAYMLRPVVLLVSGAPGLVEWLRLRRGDAR